MPDPSIVVADFNRSLVRESTLPSWCRDRLRKGSRRAWLDILLRGPLALLADRLPGCEPLAARIALGAFAGATPHELSGWAKVALSANPRALRALATLARERPGLSLVVVSRGTPSLAIEAWLAAHPLGLPARIVAPQLEVRDGRFTGRATGGLPRKRDRASLVPEGGTFLGDRDDARWASAPGRNFHFIRVDQVPGD